MRIIALFFLVIIYTGAAKISHAQLIAGNSAGIYYTLPFNVDGEHSLMQAKKLSIKKVLDSYNSPLAQYVDAFVQTCYKYKLDCYLLPAISGVESTFGKFLYPGSHNPFGWGGGMIMFNTFEEGIDTVGKGLRENYINKGAETVDQIGRIYCTGSTWAGKVSYFMKKFEQEEERQLLFVSNTLQL